METSVMHNPDESASADSDVVVFDTSSGISIEEQREILAGINAMAHGGRLAEEDEPTIAKKRGFLFPLCVNICALAFLALGFLLLNLFHGQDEQSIRDSSANLGQVERKLIQEIRQATTLQISEKDKEINDILFMLSAADAEYQELEVSASALTRDQQERFSALLSMREGYRNTLSGLQEERASIIEDSIQKEALLKAQAAEREDEFAFRYAQSQAGLEAAMEELRQLGTEQERANRIENQLSGYYRTVTNQITSGRPDDAANTLKIMKEFLNSSVYQSANLGEARKQTNLETIEALEGTIAEARLMLEAAINNGTYIPSAQGEVLAALETRNAALETKTLDQEQTLTALSSQGSAQTKIITDYATEIDALKTANSNQQDTLNRRDTEMLHLRTENSSKEQQITALNTNVAALRAQVQAANTRAQENETALATQKSEFASLQSQYDDLQRRMDAAVRAFTGE